MNYYKSLWTKGKVLGIVQMIIDEDILLTAKGEQRRPYNDYTTSDFW